MVAGRRQEGLGQEAPGTKASICKGGNYLVRRLAKGGKLRNDDRNMVWECATSFNGLQRLI